MITESPGRLKKRETLLFIATGIKVLSPCHLGKIGLEGSVFPLRYLEIKTVSLTFQRNLFS
jgi:hypothetical protein